MSPQHNFRHYRRELKKRKTPVLPYFGIYLRDFTFINDGNQKYLPDGIFLSTTGTHARTQHRADWVLGRRRNQRQVCKLAL